MQLTKGKAVFGIRLSRLFGGQFSEFESTMFLAYKEADMTVLDTLNFVVFNPASKQQSYRCASSQIDCKVR